MHTHTRAKRERESVCVCVLFSCLEVDVSRRAPTDGRKLVSIFRAELGIGIFRI